MEANEEILQELRNISNRLAAITFEKPFLTYREAGELAHVSFHKVRRMVVEGKLRRCGFTYKSPLVRRDDVIDLIDRGAFETPKGLRPRRKEPSS